MPIKMQSVLPGLFVGSYRDSTDLQQLKKYKITHIIALNESPCPTLPDKHYLCITAADTPDQNLWQYFSICNDFIHATRLHQQNVLIQCLGGMSRSATIAIAYIMSITDLNWEQALKVVRASRPVSNPNLGFQLQLRNFEIYCLAKERRRLRERFPSKSLDQLDRSKCLVALDNYEKLLQHKHICEGKCAGRCLVDGKFKITYDDATYAVQQWRFLDEPETESSEDNSKEYPENANDFRAQVEKQVKFCSPKTNENFEDYLSKSLSIGDKTIAGCDGAKSSNPNQQAIKPTHHTLRQNTAGSGEEAAKSNERKNS